MIIKHYVDEQLLNMRLINMRCKHAIKDRGRGNEVIRLSTEIGYDIAEWGSCSNHTDIRYHADVIMKMEKDEYKHPERIIICRYGFCDEPCIWIDNLHSAVMYVRQYGINVRLKDIPFYVVDISNWEPVLSVNEPGILIMDSEHMKGAVECAVKRFERSNSKELIALNYRFWEFLMDNPILLSCTEPFDTDGAKRGAKIKAHSSL